MIEGRRVPDIRGVVPAMLTPFRSNLAVDSAALQSLADYLASIDGVGAIFCNGHAGEVAALSRSERAMVVKLVVEAVDGRIPVIAGVYTDSVDDAVAMAKDARVGGAAAVTLFPPPIFADGATETSEMPYRYFRKVVRSSEIAAVIFQFAPETGLGYDLETVLRIADLPEVVAMKEGSGAVPLYETHVRALRSLNPPVSVLTSNNSWLLSSLVLGGDGILSGSGNVCAVQHVELLRSVQAGDLPRAKRVNDQLYPLVRAFYKAPAINMHTRMKVALVAMGRIPRATVRPPLLPVSRKEERLIREAVSAAGLG